MTTYYSNNNLFSYTVNNNSSSYTITNDDYTIIAAAFNRWDDIVEKNSRFSSYTISVTVNIDTLGAGILGGAGINTIYYFGSQTYGNVFPASGTITMSDGYLPSLKATTHTDGNTSYYHVFLHELGHILGIGSLWSITDFPKISYTENSETKYYYTGAKALQEYRNYFQDFSYNSFVGIPFEDNGSSGTINVHPEEGSEGSISADNRYINGVFHPGLDTELMTGWLDTSPTNAPLSKITIAYLEDMGYGVDYTKADTYRNIAANSNSSNNSSNNNIYMSNNHQNTIGWLDNSNNANCLAATVVKGFLDISGGNIITRNRAVDTIKIKGDVSLNQSTTFAATVDDNSVVVSKDNSSNFIDLADNATLTTFGFDLSGSYPQSQSGHSMSKNYDGSIIALGASENSAGTGINRGIVRVYQKSDLSWVQLGGDLSGVLDNQHFGHSVDLNGDGTILAVGTKDVSHNTLVYKYDSGSWGLYGNSIYQHVDSMVPANYTTSTTATTTTTISATCYFNAEFRRTGSSSFNDNHGNITIIYNGDVTSTEEDGANHTTGGLNNYISLHDTITWRYDYTYPIELYIKSPSTVGGTILFFWSTTSQVWLNIYWTSTGALYLRSRDGGSSQSSFETTSTFSTNTWYHVVFVPDNTQSNCKIYVDGVSQSITNFVDGSADYNTMTYNDTTGNGLLIGKYQNGINYDGGVKGYTKVIRFYNQELSTTDIANLYANRDVTDFASKTFTATTTTSVNHTFLKTGALTKPKLNKAGDKLVVFNEVHYYKSEPTPLDLSANGIVQSYQYSESDASWNYFGNKIESASVNDISGGDIAINVEGNIIAVGYPQTNSATGTTKVFKYDTSWNQIGSNIDGSTTGDHAGTSVVMDGSGDFIGIGAPVANSGAGKVSVYQNINDSWTKKGNDMEGASSNDEFGSAISMNASGDIMVVGAPNVESAKGKAYVHEYNVTDNSWNLKTSVTGTSANDKLGSSVRLNGLGTEVSVGEPGLTVSTPSYDWNFRQNSSSPIYDSISNSPATFSVTANTTDGVRTTGYIAMSPSTQGPSFSLEFYYSCHTNRDTWAGPTTYNFHLGFYSDTTNYDYFNWTQRGRYDAKNMFAIINYENGAYNYSDHQQYDSSMHPNIGMYHDVITMDGSNLIVYRNGNAIYTDTTWIGDFPTADMIYSTINTPHPSVNTSIAGTYHASSYAANLELSVYSYRLWNNHALTPSEVSTLYANRETSNYFSNVAKFRTFQMEHTQNFHNFKYLQVPIGRVSIGVENGTNMLDVSGSVFISQDLTVSDDLSLNNGSVFVHGDLSVNNVTLNQTGNINTSEINYNSDVSFSKRLFVNANDISHNGTYVSNSINLFTFDLDGGGGRFASGYLSEDGNIFASGNDTYNSNSGQTRVYEYRTVSQSEWDSANRSNTSYQQNVKVLISGGDSTLDTSKKYWIQKGYDIPRNNNDLGYDQQFYLACGGMSSDGEYIIVTSISSGWGYYVYKWDSTADRYMLFGSNGIIQPPTTGNSQLRPASVAMSSDGSTIACMTVYNQIDVMRLNGSNVYQSVGYASQPVQSFVVALSGNGLKVTGFRNSTTVRVMENNGSNSTWSQYGSDITTSTTAKTGRLNYDGTILFVGGQHYCWIYKYTTDWTLYQTIYEVYLGLTMAINKEGTRLLLPLTGGSMDPRIYVDNGTSFQEESISYPTYSYGFGYTNDSRMEAVEMSADGSTWTSPYMGAGAGDTPVVKNILADAYQTHASDLASNGSFSSDIAFNHSLIVPGNMVIVDGSNKTTYGSYTTYTDPSGEKFFHAGKSASNVFNIVNQSNVGVYMASGQSTFSSTSDKKLKTNIQPLENSLEKIEKLNPVTYQWKENKKEDIGFIAQEVEEIMPELVEENETYNGENQKGIKTSELIPFILESLNEIDKELNEL